MIIDAMPCKQTDFNISTPTKRARARAHTHTQVHTHARTRARALTHTHTHLDDINNGSRSFGDDESDIGGSEEDEVLFKQDLKA